MIGPSRVILLSTAATALCAGSASAQCELEELRSSTLLAPFGFAESVELSSKRVVSASQFNNERAYQVFERFGTDWFPTEILTPRVGTTFNQEMEMEKDVVAVGLGSDGTYGEVDPQAPSQSGEVDVFDLRMPGGFVTQTLVPSDAETGQRFGAAISISDDMMVIGAPGDSELETSSGAVYVFEYLGGEWVETAKIKKPGTVPFESFGSKVEVDGERILVTGGFPGLVILPAIDPAPGGIFAPIGGSDTVYVFERRLGEWFMTAELDVDTDRAHSFGRAMAISGDTILVSAIVGDSFFVHAPIVIVDPNFPIPPNPQPNVISDRHGVVFVYEKQGQQWVETGMLSSPIAADADDFGASLALLDDHAVVGSPLVDPNLPENRAAFVFRRTDEGWRKTAKLRAPAGDPWDGFANDVAITDHMAVVSAPFALVNQQNAGKAFVFGYGEDCSGNGRSDVCDINAGTLVDTDGDMVPDMCETGEATPFCEGSMNSLGMVSLLDVQGEVSLSMNDFSLRVEHSSPAQFGVFFVGNGETHAPFGSGMRCIGGYHQAQFSAVADGTGTVLRPLDMNAPMMGIAPYSSWNFQYAYRDGGEVQLTNAVHVTFMP